MRERFPEPKLNSKNRLVRREIEIVWFLGHLGTNKIPDSVLHRIVVNI